jgi:hypothetical protein
MKKAVFIELAGNPIIDARCSEDREKLKVLSDAQEVLSIIFGREANKVSIVDGVCTFSEVFDGDTDTFMEEKYGRLDLKVESGLKDMGYENIGVYMRRGSNRLEIVRTFK